MGFPTLQLLLFWQCVVAATIAPTLQLPLDSYFNNQGFGLVPGEAAFNNLSQSLPAPKLSQNGTYQSTKTGVTYLFPGYRGSGVMDNVLMTGQTIDVPPDHYFSIQMLVTADEINGGSKSGNLTFVYSDNTTTEAEIRSESVSTFLTIYRGEIILPSYFTENSTNYNNSNIFEYVGALDHTKTLTGVVFPDTSDDSNRLHTFAMTLNKGSGVQIQYVRPTQKMTDGVQTVEIVVNNAGSSWISGEGVEISLAAPGIRTVQPGKITRLRPGDQTRVNVGTIGHGKVATDVTMKGDFNCTTHAGYVDFGVKDWTTDLESLQTHESPEWFDGAKYGIFIHWGPYAVPGWGNSTPYEVYAEWYWWYGHHRAADKADVYDYHLKTYGPDIVYDDFFVNFTGANFDPKSWVDLFDAAGAQYFVLTTKHHDGFALFDTQNTTNRNSLHYGPRRDIVQELFDAAKTYQPHLKRGTYFSLPEWYNPDFGPYGFAQTTGNASVSWPGILATNPYTGETEPYTGRLNISDFIEDLMVPQMSQLAFNYETDIMWCDCGAANGTAEFAAKWFNFATQNNRQVTINDRCGVPQVSDFDTPEYKTFSSVQERKWESNRGMDPYSYGYNRATPESLYMNASTIISSLVDMISKNGNFLLDVGPKADGTIDETEIANLKEAGTWIHANAEAIFNTTYWFITPQVDDLRFTQSKDAFYIHSLVEPSETLLIDAPLPILPGDIVSMIGFGNNTVLDWQSYGEGIMIGVPTDLIDTGKYCWTFKIEYAS